ncbi:MAG: hypothetical protein HWQ38_09795 [Nostoc sp. NMS7]|uniref:hypothetical protein n=1 Tax=Nostoc sp. NMS7 TaxID=2815391 RepID=UPI0025F4F9CE|nr:hypothetical protein [Nostoc sp. NMS7]MBN3946762.1 hypothetical protein [Nostoc sp. NMS7]
MQVISTQAFLKIQQRVKKLTVSEFCEKWIPLLYNVYPDDVRYRRACVQELAKIAGDATTYNNIYSNWVLADNEKGYPRYIRPLLEFADKQYSIMQTLNVLPQHRLEYDEKD